MTELERIFLETVKDKILSYVAATAAEKAVGQAKAHYNNASEAYKRACHMESEALAAMETHILGEES